MACNILNGRMLIGLRKREWETAGIVNEMTGKEGHSQWHRNRSKHSPGAAEVLKQPYLLQYYLPTAFYQTT